jgi:hypothetical protein
MLKKSLIILIAMLFLTVAAVPLTAQQVLMNSAETINKGNLKLAIFPTVLFGRNGGDSVWGVAGRFGYGLSSNLDIEAKVAFFKGLKYFGVDLEYWFLKGENFNVSAALGGHMTDVNGGGDSKGIDAALLASTKPAKNLEIYGGLMLSFDSIKNGDDFIVAHLVPGIEYRISDDLDFLAEVGIALNDHARSYASVGLALYLMR